MNNSITKYHSILDYLVSAILVLPWILNSYVFGMDSWVLGFTGITILAYSLVTNYKGSLIKVLPMKVHHIFDILSGLLLALSPVLFTLKSQLWYLPGILGIVQIAAGLFHSPMQSTSSHSNKKFKMT